MTLYLTLQVMVYLYTYDIPLPANVEIYNAELVKLIEFHILDPESLIREFFDPDFTLKDFLLGNHGIDLSISSAFFDQVGVFIWIIAATLFLLFDLSILACFPRLRATIKTRVINFFKALFWNGLIRSCTIAYLQAWVYCTIMAKVWVSGEDISDVDVYIPCS